MMQIINNETVKAFVEANPKLVTRKESTTYPGLFVLKYTRKAFYDNLWSPILMDCRGTVVDADYNPIVMPFRKVFNRMENGTEIERDELCFGFEKVNGFMAAMTYSSKLDQVLVSTTGSLDSDFVKMAMDYVKDYFPVAKLTPDTTFLFEIVHPDDPHVVPEKVGAYLLAMRDVAWDSNLILDPSVIRHFTELMQAYNDKIMTPAVFHGDYAGMVRYVDSCKSEGLMVYGKVSGTVLKLKSPYYRTTKMLGRMNPEKVKTLKPESYDANTNEIIRIVQSMEDFHLMGEQEKFKFIRGRLDDIYQRSASASQEHPEIL